MTSTLNNLLNIPSVPDDTATLTVPAVPAVPDIPAPPATVQEPVKDTHNDDLKSDVDYARGQLKEVIDAGRSGLQGILELAESGDSPRAYEVVGKLIDSIVNAHKELIHIHKTKKDAEKQPPAGSTDAVAGSGAVNIEKAVFVGRTSDLLRELTGIRKQQKQAAQENAPTPAQETVQLGEVVDEIADTVPDE